MRFCATRTTDGGWSIYPDGPSNISLGVKAYFALKLMGWPADHPVLVKAREWILANGGVTAVNTFTKIYLCTLGQYDYDAVPAVPPEMILFPELVVLQYLRDFRMVARDPGAAVDLLREEAVQEVPQEQGIDELFVGGRKNAESAPEVGPEAPVRMAQFLSCGGPHLPLGGARAYPAAAQDGAEEGGEVAAGAA